MQGYLLIYLFACFTVGIACLSVTLAAARHKNDKLARAFLVLYVSLSVFLFGALLRAFIETLANPLAPSLRFGIEYLESVVGRYGVMFSLPFFAHRVFGVSGSRKDHVLAAIVLTAAAIQHVTEFLLGGVWDDRGDIFEDILFAGIILYALGLGFARVGSAGAIRPLARRLLAMLVIGIPGGVYDLFFSEDVAFRFYPLFYCVVSVGMAWHLSQRKSVRVGAVASDWGLSQREAEVAELVQRGLSNKEIAERLNISPNTVKTHLRAVFEKSGVRSRFELISAGARETSSDSSL